MNQPQIFNFKGNSVRTVLINNVPYFVGKDIAKILGYVNPTKTIRNHVDEEDKKMGVQNGTPPIIDTFGRKQYPTFINESGLYSLVLSSKLPQAREFKHWITHEVLPTIRKHGAYMTSETIENTLTNPDFIIKLAMQLKQEKKDRLAAEQRVNEMKPKALFAEAVAVSHTAILVGDLAKLLRGNGVNIGANRLFAWMRDHGYLISGNRMDRNMPTQRSMDLGLFKVKETVINHSDGHTSISKTPKVTGKGQTYFIQKFLKIIQEA